MRIRKRNYPKVEFNNAACLSVHPIQVFLTLMEEYKFTIIILASITFILQRGVKQCNR